LDDYAGWSESPPQAKDGAVQSEYHDWRRNVLVQRVNPNNYDLVALSDTGLRKINVAVAFNNERLISLTAVRWGTSENDSVMLVSIE
jgi:hypothetical protein